MPKNTTYQPDPKRCVCQRWDIDTPLAATSSAHHKGCRTRASVGHMLAIAGKTPREVYEECGPP